MQTTDRYANIKRHCIQVGSRPVYISRSDPGFKTKALAYGLAVPVSYRVSRVRPSPSRQPNVDHSWPGWKYLLLLALALLGFAAGMIYYFYYHPPIKSQVYHIFEHPAHEPYWAGPYNEQNTVPVLIPKATSNADLAKTVMATVNESNLINRETTKIRLMLYTVPGIDRPQVAAAAPPGQPTAVALWDRQQPNWLSLYAGETTEAQVSQHLVIEINKSTHELTVRAGDRIIRRYPVGLGLAGSTPEGDFTITTIIEGQNRLAPMYGAGWLGLSKDGYGIHGTNDPGSIGQDRSQGCIRLPNEDIRDLIQLVPAGTPVKITSGVCQ